MTGKIRRSWNRARGVLEPRDVRVRRIFRRRSGWDEDAHRADVERVAEGFAGCGVFADCRGRRRGAPCSASSLAREAIARWSGAARLTNLVGETNLLGS